MPIYSCKICNMESKQKSHHKKHKNTQKHADKCAIFKLELEKLSKEELNDKYNETDIMKILMKEMNHKLKPVSPKNNIIQPESRNHNTSTFDTIPITSVGEEYNNGGVSTESNDILTRRCRIYYELKQQENYRKEAKIISLQIELNESKGKSVIYENQEACSMKIVAEFCIRTIITVLVIALTQSGKTSCMIALVKNYINHASNMIPIENIYIITGLSSCSWTRQTKNRMPDSLNKRVFHRGHLKQFLKDIKDKKNVLIIIDEIQIAAKENQSIYKAFEKAGFYDKQYLLKNDIKIVQFTATPDGIMYDLEDWGENACKIKMEPGEGYMSCFDLFNQNRVKQYKDLCCENKKTGKIDNETAKKNITEVKQIVDNYETPRYHIIRTPGGKYANVVINNFRKVFGEIRYELYDRESEINNINSVLKKAPDVDTFIFVKEKLRCADTLIKTHLGVKYERCTKGTPDDAVVIQGLLGRMTGYDDNGDSICFTNVNTIKKYKRLWDSNFRDNVNWKSKTTKYNKTTKQISAKSTFNNPELINGMDITKDDNKESKKPIIQKFKTQPEAKIYCINKLNRRGPNNRTANKDGMFEATIRSNKGVYTCEQLEAQSNCGLGGKIKYRLCPCYKDINDKSTLEFWVIHY
jgi:hypothetical protein